MRQRVALHQRHDHEAAAVGEGADLERGPGQRGQLGGGGRDERQPERPGVTRRAAAAPGELGEPAREQHDDHERADHDGGRGAARAP